MIHRNPGARRPPARFVERSIASLISLAVLAPCATALFTPAAWAQNTRAATAAKFRGTPVTLNFVNAEIEGVARAMGAILGQQFVVDPRVKGQITLYTDQPVSPREAYVNFLAALRGLGFTVVEVGGLYKIVPEADAKLQAGTVAVGGGRVRGDQVLTQIFKLTHENANNLVPVLRPLISPNNTINANPGNNSLVITDYADNLERIGKIIAAMDTPASGDVEVIQLQHAVASDIVQLVQRLTDSTGATSGGIGGVGAVQGTPGVAGVAGAQASVMVDQRSNTLLVRAPNPAKLAAIRSLVEKLDRPVDGANGMGNIWVVYLKNADAVRLATVLRAAYAATQNNGSNNAAGGGGLSSGSNAFGALGGANQAQNNLGSTGTSGTSGQSAQASAPVSASAGPSTGGFVQADPATNSLIITAPEPMYRQLRAMIDQLDSRRAQVYIESMIVEITGNDSTDLGFQWQALGSGGNVIPGAGTNFSTGGDSILTGAAATSVIGALAGVQPGLNVGLVKNYNGTYGLSAIAHLLQSRGDTNIVSTPNLVTLDNEEAKIIVGQNIPFVTGSYATTSGTTTSNPFTTIDRKDVGVTLRIKPQIGENGTVRMTIYQESSSIAAQATGTTSLGPTTNKKSIESSVVVDDGSIIVLGGLIEDTVLVQNDKVPLLGDIPYLGALFRSETRTKTRTNQMVFLRPVVMRDGAASDRFSIGKYDMIRAEQSRNQLQTNPLMPIGSVPVLPPLTPGSNPLVPLAAPAVPEGRLRPVAPAASDIPVSIPNPQ